MVKTSPVGRTLLAGRRETGEAQRRELIVPDGLIFPILAALSRFVVFDQDKEVWQLNVPKVFRDEDMIEAARRQLKQAQGKPVHMGRSGAAYEGLMLLTEMAVRYAEQARANLKKDDRVPHDGSLRIELRSVARWRA